MQWDWEINYFGIVAMAKKRYDQYLEPVWKAQGLTRCEMDVLLFLYNNPQFDRAADIVNRRGIAKSHVSLSVSHLEELGLVQRWFSAEDRRNAHLKLTEQAQGVAAQGKQAQQQFLEELYGCLTAEELANWEMLTRKILQNLLPSDGMQSK